MLPRMHMCFTHFAQLNDSVSGFLAVTAIARGMAFQCSIPDEGLNIMTPFVLGAEGRSGKVTPLSEEHVSAIFVTVKDLIRKTTISVDEGIIDFSPNPQAYPNDVRPSIVLSMELGVKAEAPKLSMTIPYAMPSNIDQQHPCYVIKTFGCDGTTFRAVENEVQWAILLGMGGLLNEHPRQNKGMLDVVRRMKPFWQRTGVPFFDWNELSLDSESYHYAVESSMDEIQPNSAPLGEGALWG
jgi:hypothetical protein